MEGKKNKKTGSYLVQARTTALKQRSAKMVGQLLASQAEVAPCGWMLRKIASMCTGYRNANASDVNMDALRYAYLRVVHGASNRQAAGALEIGHALTIQRLFTITVHPTADALLRMYDWLDGTGLDDEILVQAYDHCFFDPLWDDLREQAKEEMGIGDEQEVDEEKLDEVVIRMIEDPNRLAVR